MSTNNENDFNVLQRMQSFLIEDLERDIDGLSDGDVAARLKHFDSARVLTRTRSLLAQMRDSENREAARARIALVQRLGKSTVTAFAKSVDEFRAKLAAACMQDPSLAVQFREFEMLEDPRELERALALLDRIQSERGELDK